MRRSAQMVRQFYSVKSVVSAPDGSFSLEGIQPGKYFLYCSPPRNPVARTALAPTFFPASVSSQGASSLLLNPGEKQSGLVFEVQRERIHTVSGRLLYKDRLADLSKLISLDLTRRGDLDSAAITVDPVRAPLATPYERILFTADGQFRIEGVFRGAYNLILKSKAAFISQVGARIDVPDRDLLDLKLDYIVPTKVSGRLFFQSDDNVEASQSLTLPRSFYLRDPDNAEERTTLVSVDKSGVFQIPALPPGNYEAYFFSGSPEKRGYYIESLAWNGSPQQRLQFQNAGFPESQLTLSLRAGRGEVTVSAPITASRVIVFPLPFREIDTLRGAVILAESGPGNQFQLSSVIPGSYFACAVDSFDGGNFSEWVNDPSNLANLKKYCQSIQVKRNDKLSISLPVLPFATGKF